jgi:hypothetical protein
VVVGGQTWYAGVSDDAWWSMLLVEHGHGAGPGVDVAPAFGVSTWELVMDLFKIELAVGEG